jgi:hypothetical protein
VKSHVFETEQWVPAALERAFGFFLDAANLELMTPPFLSFKILTPLPIEMREGALIEYRLRINGAPVRWLTRIDEWFPGRAFTDTQLRGPYARWVHRHMFESRDGGTQVRDRADYALPLDPFSRPAHALLVRPAIERIFDYRREVIARVLRHPAARA